MPPGDERLPLADRPVVTDAEARALASSVRWRILQLCSHDALCNSDIAAALGQRPATILHHVRTLVETGFLEALPERRGRRGAREIPYRATHKLRSVNAGDVTDPALRAFEAEFLAAPYERRTLATGRLRLTAAEMDELSHRLEGLIAEFDARPERPGAEDWGIFLATHPATRDGQGN